MAKIEEYSTYLYPGLSESEKMCARTSNKFEPDR